MPLGKLNDGGFQSRSSSAILDFSVELTQAGGGSRAKIGISQNRAVWLDAREKRMETNEQVEAALLRNEFDFIDFGCSEGGSIRIAQSLFRGGKGLGIDADPKKIKTARAAGFDVYHADITQLERFSGSVRFVMMNHFLEHLNDVAQAKKCVESASQLARDFVFIKQPYFDADPYLFENKLQFYWSNWGCHPNHMTSLEFFHLLQPMLGNAIERFAIYGVRQVADSSDASIHSILSPSDQHSWDEHKHPPKPAVIFDRDVYYETAVLIGLPGAGGDFERLEKSFHWSKKVFDSADLDRMRGALPGLPYEWRPDRENLQVSGHIADVELTTGHDVGERGAGMRFLSTGDDPIILLPERNFASTGGLLVSADLTAPCATDAQLFYQTKNNMAYSEQSSIRKGLRAGRNQIRFELKVAEVCGRLRFDPGRVPGRYILHNLKVEAI